MFYSIAAACRTDNKGDPMVHSRRCLMLVCIPLLALLMGERLIRCNYRNWLRNPADLSRHLPLSVS